MGDAYQTIGLAISVANVALSLGVLAIVIVRFRKTPAGVLLAISYGAGALLIVASRVVFTLATPSAELFDGINVVMVLVDAVFTAINVAGIALIPRSLRARRR